MSPFDPGRDPGEFPPPGRLNDTQFYKEWEAVKEQWHDLQLAEKAMHVSSEATSITTLLSLPERTRLLFAGISVVTKSTRSLRGMIVANRFADFEAEWLSRKKEEQ